MSRIKNKNYYSDLILIKYLCEFLLKHSVSPFDIILEAFVIVDASEDVISTVCSHC